MRARRHALDQAQLIYGERLAPAFGVFQFMDTSEVGLSRVIAWLLDAKADHAQGSKFLQAFLRWLDIDWPDQAIRNARVQVEAPVPMAASTRFIDILVSGGHHALAIENKIGAPDQPNQVTDYIRFLEKGYSDGSSLLYLTPDGRSPSGTSITAREAGAARASNRLLERSYEGLIDFLRQCLPACRSPKVSFFIEDFVDHIAKSVVGIENMEETVKLAQEIADDPKDLTAALEIFEAEHEVKSIIIKRCQSEIAERAEALGWSIMGSVEFGGRGDYLMAMYNPDDTWGFGFSFYQSRHRTLFYGLARSETADARRRPAADLLALLNEIQQGRGDPEWPWWLKPHPHNHFFPYAAGWAGTKDFWIAVNNGEFAERFVTFASAMKAHLKKARLLDRLK